MNYIELINRFWQLRRSKRITSTQTDLYFFLLQECNQRDWENPFQCSNGLVCSGIGITEKTLIDARNVLKQLGLIDFENGITKQRSPNYYLPEYWKKVSNKVSIPVSIPGGNPVSIPGGKKGNIYTKQNKKETKQNNSKSHSGAQAPGIEKNEVPFWKSFIETWNGFYKKNVGENYNYLEKDFNHFKKIYNFLKKRAADKKFEFTEDNFLAAFKFFLQRAWDKDQWLRNNFSVANCLSQFNQIANGKNESNSKNGAPTGGAVNTASAFSAIDAMYRQNGD